MPLMMATIPDAEWTGLHTALFVVAANICAWIPVLLILRAHRENGFATVWDLASGTRVVVKPKGAVRPSIEPENGLEPAVTAGERVEFLGPYRIIREMVPEKWIVAMDPVLRRQVWLLRRDASELSQARRNLARPGRLRWLQTVVTPNATWDAFEATQGVPFFSLVDGEKPVPWSSLRFWLCDLATELWEAAGDHTLPAELSLDHVWITTQGHAVLLDNRWPCVTTPAEYFSAGDLGGQQRFLSAVAACTSSTNLPLHARGVLKNLAGGKFEKLSFLTGILRGLLDKPAEVSRGIRVGSIFMLPLYVWIAVFVGHYHDKPWYDYLGEIVIISPLVVLGAIALIQLLGLWFRTTPAHATFRLAVVNAKGEAAGRAQLLVRWAIVWLPLLVPMWFVVPLIQRSEVTGALICGSVWLVLWISAAVYAVIHPHRGLHDRLAHTWVVRR